MTTLTRPPAFRLATTVAALLVAGAPGGGCGSGADPCASQGASCITLTVKSSSVKKIDDLQLTAFGDTRSSMAAAAGLPVKLAVVPPSGTPAGKYAVSAQASLGGQAVGAGSTIVEVGAGRVSAEIDLAAPGANGCVPPMPDVCGKACVDLASDPANCNACGFVCSTPHAASTCEGGVCGLGKCDGGFANCDQDPYNGCESDPMTDAANCSSCGHACMLGAICVVAGCTDNIAMCSSPGATCAQPQCSANTFAISAGGGIAVDTSQMRKMWTRATRGPATFADAAADCKALVLEGISGWRLPNNLNEVPQYMTGASMQVPGCPTCNPAVDQAAFPDTPMMPSGYWTQQSRSMGASYFLVDYCEGSFILQDVASSSHPYRCVHEPL